MTTISTQAMLASPSIRTWSARRYDATATATVAKEHHNEKDMGRYNKCLIDVKADSFVRISKIANEVRTWIYEHSLPWTQTGARILPAAMYLDFNSEVLKYRRKFDDAVETFLDEYDDLKAAAKKALNGLYNEEDYPAPGELRAKYGIEVVYFPVPSANDFRVEMSEREVDRIRRQITQSVEQATADAMRDLWERLHDSVVKMAAALKDPNRRFHDSLVGNVIDIVSILPKLNMTDDPDLIRMTQEVRESLTKVSPQTLRDDADVRAEQAKRADKIAKMMAGMYKRQP